MISIKQFFPLLFLVVIFTSCQEQISEKSPNNRLDSKHIPAENFFLQRAYPDVSFDINSYLKGLRQAKNTSIQKEVDGFDEPWEVQGPGNIGARINTIAVHPTNENEMLAGFARGGIFKTIDYGANWYPVFDDQILLAIGCIVYDPGDPTIVYAGTGDPNISGLPGIGDGIYKSMDGGETWTNIGLSEQRIISKIAINPNDPNTIYVGCMGLPFERNNDRGLYKTTDGGANWEQVLFVADEAGIIDLLMNPNDPEVLYAASWDRIRNNTESYIFGEHALIHKTIDGGANWTELSEGLPEGDQCRIGLTMSPQNPDHIYAMYVDTTYNLGGVYHSIDAGENWLEIPTNGFDPLGGFGWYFAKIRVNPNDENDLFILGVDLWRTVDLGGTWFEATPPWFEYTVHADKHDLVFTASDSILLATDGGLYKTDILTDEWKDIENIPTTQFYRVGYNPHVPSWYYGGAQDNGSTGGNNENINAWPRIYGGDGFQMLFHPDDPEIFFAETQNGGINVTTDAGFNEWYGATDGIEGGDRKNWDMQYIISPHDPSIMYTGTYRVYKAFADPIPTWFPISEDVTDGLVLHPRFHTITCLTESPLVESLLYVGTVDGNISRSFDGENWENVSAGLPDRYITEVKASPSFENTVYISHSGYKDNEFIPRIHRSDDNGDSWIDISSDLPDLAINDLYILPNHQDSILFVATDGGVYGSKNAGANWERLGTNMPFVIVFDLEFNPIKNELIAGTFARSIMSYPLDSLLFEPPVAVEETAFQIKDDFIKISPNPTTDFIYLELYNFEKGKDLEIAIVDLQGKLMLQKQYNGEGSVNLKLDVQDFQPGEYFVKVKIRHRVLSKAFIKI